MRAAPDRMWVAWAAIVLAATQACDETEASPAESSGAQSKDRAGQGEQSREPSLKDHRPDLDLQRLAHLADVDHHGLYIDFGTPARMKYTVGHWRTKWGTDGRSDGVPYTYAGKRGRIYFPVDEPGPLTIRLRLEPIGTERVSPYVNGEGIELVRFAEGSGFRTYDIEVPEKQVQQGENRLMLVFGGTKKVGDEKISVAMDTIRVIPGHDVPSGKKSDFEPLRYGDLVQKVKLGDEARKALRVRRPTTLSYYVQVPDGAKLGFGVGVDGKGKAPVEVHVRPENGDRDKIYSAKASGTWEDAVVDLSNHAGTIARIELTARGEGEGRVAWSRPTLYVPRPEEVREPDEAENVIVLLVDTLRADKLEPYNPDTPVETPRFDTIAEQGTLFENAQAPENWTKPSCASLLTALYPVTHETKEDASRLPSAARMVSEHYAEQGFATSSFIANGYISKKFGFDQGWDHHTNYIRESKSTEAENVFKEAGDWIEEHKDERFFAYIQTIDPHVPYDPPERFLKKYDDAPYDGKIEPRLTAQQLEKAKKTPPEIELTERDKERLEALYDGEVGYHDHWMGKFIDRLEKMGVWKDTLFVFTSDHGEEFEDHGSWGHGHSTYQELLHVPLVFHMPGVVPEGKRVEDTVNILDVGPTVLDLTGVDDMKEAEGRSLAGYFTGEHPAGPKVAFSDFLYDHRVIQAGRWKLRLRGLNVDFFDLREDPGEQNELDKTTHPVAFRYTRVMLGQFLGASDRGAWLSADQDDQGPSLEAEKAEMDEETRDQLRALGYAN